mgnify:CR=1 FL=1
MCIRDRVTGRVLNAGAMQLVLMVLDYRGDRREVHLGKDNACLLYTSDAADERSSVDLGGRRIIKQKKTVNTSGPWTDNKTNKTIATIYVLDRVQKQKIM